jgi:hypothetical protein
LALSSGSFSEKTTSQEDTNKHCNHQVTQYLNGVFKVRKEWLLVMCRIAQIVGKQSAAAAAAAAAKEKNSLHVVV